MKNCTKKISISIALITILTISAFITLQSANAAVTEWNTYCFVTAAPNPVQIGHTLIIGYRLDKTNPLSNLANGIVWENFQVKITDPDGIVETKSSLKADSTGGSWLDYVPTKIGTYTLQSSFPGQWVNSTGTGAYQRWYKPSTSVNVELVVQEEPIQTVQDVPLPTDYWTRPIYGENKGWSQISDNWLMEGYDYLVRGGTASTGAGAFAPYTSAPNSAHIVWSQPVAFGGIVGGQFGDEVYYTGLTYEQFYTPIVISGRIIYIDHGPTSKDAYGTRCLDLYTGKEIWYLDNTTLLFAQTLSFNSPNEHGVLSYLCSVSQPPTNLFSMDGTSSNRTWRMHDAFTGRQLLTVTNLTAIGETKFGSNGEILSYVISGTGSNRRLTMWNSTLAILGTETNYFSPATGAVIDGKRGIQWNVSIPAEPSNVAIKMIGEDTILATYVDSTTYPITYVQAALPATIKRLTDGSYPTSIPFLWTQNRTNIESFDERITRNIQDGYYCMFDEGRCVLHGYSIKTGQEMWTSEPITTGWGHLTRMYEIAYGKCYIVGFDGYVRAYNLNDGKLAWEYYKGSAGYENAYGTYPAASGITIADGKIYTYDDEHTPDSVMWRGGKLYCINATTGDLIWKISGWLRLPVISDGYLTTPNALDNQIYTFGKGPSATSINAPLTAITQGQSMMLTGTVTDQSPGQPDTPAVSDASMASWMEYLHMQKPIPANVTGVEVSLDTLDPNGNSIHIATVTTDMSGTYNYLWTPDIPGTYTVTATFVGTQSYGSSYAETAIGVVEAPASTPTATPITMPPYELYTVGTGIAIIIAVAAVGLLILRKRP